MAAPHQPKWWCGNWFHLSRVTRPFGLVERPEANTFRKGRALCSPLKKAQSIFLSHPVYYVRSKAKNDSIPAVERTASLPALDRCYICRRKLKLRLTAGLMKI
jgi:hypothetical protein